MCGIVAFIAMLHYRALPCNAVIALHYTPIIYWAAKAMSADRVHMTCKTASTTASTKGPPSGRPLRRPPRQT